MTTIGILHPGEMGSAVGAAARAGGTRVIWASARRGPATRKRAETDGLDDVGALVRLARESEIILSVCPPANAPDVAREVAALRFGGAFADGNAIAPATARTVGDIVRTSAPSRPCLNSCRRSAPLPPIARPATSNPNPLAM